MEMGRPNSRGYPPYMRADASRGGWVVANPVTGKRRRFSDEAKARETAVLLAEWVEKERQARTLDAGLPTIAGLVDRWKTDCLPFMPWDKGTRQNNLYKIERVRRELGARQVARTDRLFLHSWLSSFCHNADQWNKWRYVLVLLWKFALEMKFVLQNEPECIQERSTSKKLEMNQKVRKQLDIEGFRAIHEKAPGWLQLAMELSIVTLQARSEVCNLRHTDFRAGHLFVIRDKVSGDSDMAFIKIVVTEQIDELRRRALTMDNSVSPYLVHRAPDRRRREWIEGKPHWTWVVPDYLSKAFAEARDQVRRFEAMPPRERPTFHEIRGLGARIYRDRGVSEDAIRALMTHAHKRTTQIYLDRGAAALSDADYVEVRASLTLAEMVGSLS